MFFLSFFVCLKEFSFINLYSIPISNQSFCDDIWTFGGNQALPITCSIPSFWWRLVEAASRWRAGFQLLGQRVWAGEIPETLIQRSQELRPGQSFTFQQDNQPGQDNTSAAERPEHVCPPMVPVQPDEASEDLQRGMTADPKIQSHHTQEDWRMKLKSKDLRHSSERMASMNLTYKNLYLVCRSWSIEYRLMRQHLCQHDKAWKVKASDNFGLHCTEPLKTGWGYIFILFTFSIKKVVASTIFLLLFVQFKYRGNRSGGHVLRQEHLPALCCERQINICVLTNVRWSSSASAEWHSEILLFCFQMMNKSPQFEGPHWESFCSNLKSSSSWTCRVYQDWRRDWNRWNYHRYVCACLLVSLPRLKHHQGLTGPACKKRNK